MLTVKKLATRNTCSSLYTSFEKCHSALGCVGKAAYSTSLSDKEILHRSILPTDHFQKSLPRLPIPKLEDTCVKYLKSQRVLLNDEKYNHTEKVAHAFRDGVGKELQDTLVERDQQNKHTNYISGSWFDMYLKDRRALMINHNPYIVFNDDQKKEYNDQLVKSTNFVVSSMRFMKTLKSNILEPEVFHLNPAKSDTDKFRRIVRLLPQSVSWYGAYLFKAFPLDMSQYSKLFCSTRIPRPVKDELYTEANSRHLVVLRKGHFYSFDVLDNNGNILPAGEIMAHLQYILSDSRPPQEHPLAVCSSLGRDSWTTIREKLVAAGNEEVLKKIDGGVFVLALDETTAEDNRELSLGFLHGDGTNRWFDKSFELIITKSGKACVNFEHAWGDGVAVLRYFNETFKDVTTKPNVHPDSKPAIVDSSAAVQQLELNLTDDIKRDIQKAMVDFKTTTSNLELSYIEYEKYGKNYLKKQRLSPDSFMQLAFQMGYYRLYGKTVATYESCSTAAFKHGRTETIRPATLATSKACELFDPKHSQASVEEMQAALAECSRVHGELTKEAAMGKGWDRHLYGLKAIAAEEGGTLPDIFTDPAYGTINQNILSTSTLSSPAVLIGGFAPVVPNGFGVGYGTDDNMLGLNVTGFPDKTNVADFLDCVKSSFDDMHEVLEGRSNRK